MKVCEKALGVSWWMESLGKSRGQNLWACGPFGFGLGTSLGTPFTMIPPRLFHTLSIDFGFTNLKSVYTVYCVYTLLGWAVQPTTVVSDSKGREWPDLSPASGSNRFTNHSLNSQQVEQTGENINVSLLAITLCQLGSLPGESYRTFGLRWDEQNPVELDIVHMYPLMDHHVSQLISKNFHVYSTYLKGYIHIINHIRACSWPNPQS